MPSLPTRLQQPSPVNPQVPIPGDFPSIPKEIMDRFPNSAADWQRRLDEFWGRTAQAIQEAQKQTAAQVNSQVIFTVDRFLIYANGVPTPMFALDATGVRLGNVLVVNTPGRKIYIGAGTYANANTPFYVDTLGNFSLGDSFVWDAETDTLTITGIINATSGTIGGFTIGADYIRDTGNTFGLASTVTGSQDVRFWAGDTFANRGTAPIRIYEDGTSFFSTVLGARLFGTADGASNTTLSLSGAVATAASLAAASITTTFTVGQNGSSTYLLLAQNNTVAKSTFTGLTAYGLRFDLSNATGTGTIDNAYGIYIDTVNIGTANWGLYVATTARNFFAGDIQAASIGANTRGSGAFTDLSALSTTFITLTRSTSETVMVRNSLVLKHLTSGNMADGFGTRMSFNIADSGADNTVVTLDAVRNGSDSLADLIMSTSAEALRLTAGAGVRVASLAGVGTRNVVADASGNLSAP